MATVSLGVSCTVQPQAEQTVLLLAPPPHFSRASGVCTVKREGVGVVISEGGGLSLSVTCVCGCDVHKLACVWVRMFMQVSANAHACRVHMYLHV